MKRVYWRPPSVSRRAMVLITTLALGVLLAVELLPVKRKQPHYEEKLQAAHLARQGLGMIKAEKLRRGIHPDPEADPEDTGMIGTSLSPVTSNTGYLSAKRTSVNPNFAAVMVQLLRRAGVRRGDVVGVGLSGSFPSLNISTFAALQTLDLDPIVIASASASQWGANNVGLLWIDMERVLFEKKLFRFRSVAASRGGIDDRGYGMSQQGRVLIDEAIARNNLQMIDPASLQEAIEQRMDLYQQFSKGRPIRAYINIGGGAASVGTHLGKKLFRAGLNLDPPRGKGQVDSVMMRFAERDVPVIHITGIANLARRYGLALQPQGVPRPGEGNVFFKLEYNPWLAGTGIVVILAVMLAFIRMDVGLRILKGVQRRPQSSREPQPMV
jgi:poly-gamma-glutamate system protein